MVIDDKCLINIFYIYINLYIYIENDFLCKYFIKYVVLIFNMKCFAIRFKLFYLDFMVQTFTLGVSVNTALNSISVLSVLEEIQFNSFVHIIDFNVKCFVLWALNCFALHWRFKACKINANLWPKLFGSYQFWISKI